MGLEGGVAEVETGSDCDLIFMPLLAHVLAQQIKRMKSGDR